MVSTLNRVKYSGLSFDTIVDDLRARLQVKFANDFNDFSISSLGIMLIDIVAFGLDGLSFYQDRRATDLYLSTARTRKSVSRLTRQLGYKMRAAIASSVDLDVSIQTPQAFSIPIPKGFQFQGPNELIFEVAQEVTFPPNAGSETILSVPCYEGQSFTETFASDGTSNQVFTLRRVPDSYFVVSGTVQVLIDGAPFEETEFLSFDKTDQFEVGYNDDPPTVRFGDGTAGNIPTAGASIQISYVASRGKAGQVAQDTITDVVSGLVVNFTSINLSITNPEAASGGDDLEDIEHAKSAAGLVWKTRQVAVTRGDYEALSSSFADPLFGRVAVAQAISSRSAASDLALQNMIGEITAAVLTPKPAVDAQVAAANAALDEVDLQLTVLETALSSITGATNITVTEIDNSLTSARATKNKAEEIDVDAQEIQGFVVSGKAAVDAITTAGSSQLTSGDKTNLKAFFDLIAAQATSTSAASSDIEASATDEIASLGAIKDQAHAIGLSTIEANSFLLVADTARLAVVAEVGVTTPTPTGIRANLLTVSTTILDETVTVGNALDDIFSHVDQILASDCQANLVTVPILARDAAGFYSAPSSSLIQALQAFLTARKEVTQTVVVVSGANFLVRAVITVRLGIKLGISPQVTKTSAETAIDGVLRDRSFDSSLYTSDIVDALTSLSGVSFANVKINGNLGPDGVTVFTTKLDPDGNLIVSTNEVVTKGLVTVNVEVLSN